MFTQSQATGRFTPPVLQQRRQSSSGKPMALPQLDPHADQNELLDVVPHKSTPSITLGKDTSARN
jgi:hypothetical protein